MRHSVLALLHGVAPEAAPAALGHLAGAFARCGHDVGTASFTDGSRPPRLHLDGIRMLVVMGSVESCTDESVPWLDEESRFLCGAITRGLPVLGIGFGAQLLAQVAGGRVVPGGAIERGLVDVRSGDPDRIPAGPWYTHHRDGIVPPPEAEILATTDASVQAFAYGPHLGVQFHPEVTPATLDTWRTSFSGTNGDLDADDPGWETDRSTLHEHRVAFAQQTGTLVRGFVRSAQRHPAEAV